MCAQKSNREALIEGALRCLEREPVGNVTARAIATAAGANLASIGYHFASKDALVAEALALGFRRWTAELVLEFAKLARHPERERLHEALAILRTSIERRGGFVRAYVSALSMAAYDPELRRVLLASYREGITAVAALAGLGSGSQGEDAAALLMAAFDGVLIQFVLYGEAWLTPARAQDAFQRLAEALRIWNRARTEAPASAAQRAPRRDPERKGRGPGTRRGR